MISVAVWVPLLGMLIGIAGRPRLLFAYRSGFYRLSVVLIYVNNALNQSRDLVAGKGRYRSLKLTSMRRRRGARATVDCRDAIGLPRRSAPRHDSNEGLWSRTQDCVLGYFRTSASRTVRGQECPRHTRHAIFLTDPQGRCLLFDYPITNYPITNYPITNSGWRGNSWYRWRYGRRDRRRYREMMRMFCQS